MGAQKGEQNQKWMGDFRTQNRRYVASDFDA